MWEMYTTTTCQSLKVQISLSDVMNKAKGEWKANERRMKGKPCDGEDGHEVPSNSYK